MGRTETSKGLAPPSIRKDIRAKQARHIINKVIPAILVSNARARRGVESSELIVDPGPVRRDRGGGKKQDIDSDDGKDEEEDRMYMKRKGQGRRKVKNEEVVVEGIGKEKRGKMKDRMEIQGLQDGISSLQLDPQTQISKRNIRILLTDSLNAAHILSFPSLYPSSSTTTSAPPFTPSKAQKTKAQNTCILNMASPLRPGAGVLTGATSQEEYLCARTTLLPSLLESYYRLPEYGAVYSPDILVFRNQLPLGDSKGELSAKERWWVDVVSAGMLRFPELESGVEGEGRLGERDRRVVEGKMRGVLRVCVRKGIRRVVLGAWGCGAFGCPVGDVAKGWRRVLDGGVGGGGGKGKGKGKGAAEIETFKELEEVVFAIGNRQMARAFAEAFGGVEVEHVGGTDEGSEEEGDEVAEELRRKIGEMEGQLGKVWNVELKERMGVILEGLKGQLREREGGREEGSDGDDPLDLSSGPIIFFNVASKGIIDIQCRDHIIEIHSLSNLTVLQ
ncbi:hypothetical protein T440DRAFT_498427 [Plenodomus tracheiphilus IPT5]|uniref:Microbial-type PARG catalytic domain-containing protein n=1 Tax=Plenodomus tracheiphilus IPT5 TaxID=1408161 RepID=A0A6A7B7Y7_9PLEO|nr:hypothetical protein T440DRAFT_498427 [Plenodomus tracheiphilus IPT5]